MDERKNSIFNREEVNWIMRAKMIHDREFEEKLFDAYKKMDLGNSNICNECHSKISDLSFPATIWGIGKDYADSEYKLLFVGKNARGNPGKKVDSAGFLDCRDMADNLWNKPWAYYSYVKNIAEKIYPYSGINSISYTNILKCNNSWSTTKDIANKLQKDNCIKNMQVIKKEVQILNPQKIIFLTSWYYDEYFSFIFDKMKIIDDSTEQIGKKKMPWKDFVGTVGNNQIEVLRIGHPERLKKDDFVNKVCNWIIN